MDKNINQPVKWSENVIIVDAEYIDRVVFNLTVNFERMLGRRIPPADLARWIDCVALDGGLRPGEHETQVVLIHEKDSKGLENIVPSEYESSLHGKAFKDQLGEFVISAVPVEAMTTKNDLLLDVVSLTLPEKEVKRIIIIPNGEDETLGRQLRNTLQQADEDKHVTVLAMEPIVGGNFKQEILGYSLLQALGIRADEIR
ncbi:MAG: hypothetical protein II812_08785 [Prevotella sp.]|nr:hypothetical protein [Prevotella sp.]